VSVLRRPAARRAGEGQLSLLGGILTETDRAVLEAFRWPLGTHHCRRQPSTQQVLFLGIGVGRTSPTDSRRGSRHCSLVWVAPED